MAKTFQETKDRIAELEHIMRGEIPDGTTWQGSEEADELLLLQESIKGMIDTGAANYDPAVHVVAAPAPQRFNIVQEPVVNSRFFNVIEGQRAPAGWPIEPFKRVVDARGPLRLTRDEAIKLADMLNAGEVPNELAAPHEYRVVVGNIGTVHEGVNQAVERHGPGTAFDQLGALARRCLVALEGEEDSVKAEHASLIRDLHATLDKLHISH